MATCREQECSFAGVKILTRGAATEVETLSSEVVGRVVADTHVVVTAVDPKAIEDDPLENDPSKVSFNKLAADLEAFKEDPLVSYNGVGSDLGLGMLGPVHPTTTI